MWMVEPRVIRRLRLPPLPHVDTGRRGGREEAFSAQLNFGSIYPHMLQFY
jgi:hypothetical protein